MRIAFFHEVHAGGARRTVNEFGKRLKEKHNVDLYYVDEKQDELEEKNFHSANFYKFIPEKWTGGNWKAKLYKDSIELIKLYRLHQKIAHDINAKNYDLVIIHPSKFTQAPFILRFLKTSKIYYCQEPLRMVYEAVLDIKKDLPPSKYYYEKLNRFIRKHIDKSNIKFADRIVANSEHTCSNIKSAYGLGSIYSYLGVDTENFKPTSINKEIDILFVGANDYTDGYRLMEEAKKYMNKQVNIKLRSSEKQWITDDDMVKLYCRSKIAVALAYNEPFGLVPLEAMACGVPVVAVNEGGYKESVVDGKTGYLVPRNPKILAQKLNHLLASPNLLSKMGQDARSLMESEWTWDKRTHELETQVLYPIADVKMMNRLYPRS